jgi:hypothetical protein
MAAQGRRSRGASAACAAVTQAVEMKEQSVRLSPNGGTGGVSLGHNEIVRI